MFCGKIRKKNFIFFWPKKRTCEQIQMSEFCDQIKLSYLKSSLSGSALNLASFYLLAGLILVSEPYFNEAGYEKQRGTQHGQENSRMYNEMAILKLVQVSSLISFTL